MKLKNTLSNWGAISQGFHWLIALLIFVAIATGIIAEEMGQSPAKLKLFILHKSFGVTILALVVMRLLWRLTNAVPSAATGISRLNHQLAELGHWAIYALMFVVPLSGWALNSAANFPFQWFNLFAVPDLPGVPDSAKGTAGLVHYWSFVFLAFAIAGHVVMVIVHKHLHRSDLLQRMVPISSAGKYLLGFAVVTAAVIALSWLSVNQQAVQQPIAVEPSENRAEVTVSVATSELPLRLSVSSESQLQFEAAYDGVEFVGGFNNYRANIYFDPANLDKSLFDVSITTGSVTTPNSDWTDTLAGGEWFASNLFPQAHYVADNFAVAENGFVANGELTIKDKKHEVPFTFQWQEVDGERNRLVGVAYLDRRQFDVGTGMWQEDETVGFEVKVMVDLLLEKAP